MLEQFRALGSQYEEALLRHTSELASVESSIRSLSYFLPGRFKDAEVASEALFAGTNLLSSWHDSILLKAVNQKLPPSEQPKPSLHARYTSSWRDSSSTYAFAAKLLRLINYTGLLLEMIAHKKLKRKGKWRVIIIIEILKVFLRLTIFKATNYRPALDPPLPQREVDPAIFQPQTTTENTSSKSWTGTRSGRTYPSIAALSKPSPDVGRFSPARHPTKASIQSFLSSSALSVQDLKPSQQLLSQLDALPDQWNEVLSILRPLIYVLALRRWGRKAIMPFALSFVLEYLIIATLRTRLEQSDLDRQEQDKKQLGLFKYLLRGPIWYGFTKPRISAIANGVEKIPLLGIAGTVVKDYLELYERYIYCVGP